MLKISFDGRENPAQLVKQLDGYRDGLPKAISIAINRTAQLVRTGIVAEMQKVFDRPTPWTLNGLYVENSTSKTLQATVWLKDEEHGMKGKGRSGKSGVPASVYLQPEIFGGGRNAKSTEKLLRDEGILGSRMFTVPARDAVSLLDKYGNLSGGIINQMRSGLGIEKELGRQANITEKSKKKHKKRPLYFVIGRENQVGIGRRKPSANPGHRSPNGRPSSGPLETVVWFVKAPHYRPRLDFFGVGQKAIDEHLDKEIQRAMRDVLSWAKG